jgi:hypothetical protein
MHSADLRAVPLDIDHRIDGNLSLDGEVQSGLNLVLTLKSPSMMVPLAAILKARKSHIDAALKSLNYVHFARFLPTPDYSAMQVITVFDGPSGSNDIVQADDAEYTDSLKSYVMDFVAVVGDEFTAMLEFVKDAPRLPVQKYPRDFVDFVIANNRKVNPWSAYPDLTVIDILRAQFVR